MLADQLVEPVPMHVSERGVEVSVRMPWYRALPLCSVLNLRLTIDGTEIPREKLRFGVNGAEYTEAGLAEEWQQWWYVLDSARIVAVETTVGPGEHEVEAGLSLSIPYLPVPGGPLVITESNTKRLTTEVRS
ncbi:flagellar biosynthesis protein [Amycolatopsis acidicola]|uniref:C-deglycosylation enzyme beta subunit n=1 Tax=Amycolatopsis acidicola TaxID=2596893 RepID=A0A5N0V6M9_9PSEU|nr:DUF6379 domain-containing protein [Amycolatopsis acidicola]KAA9160720.1 flagellar biosynthesis protein [Amycolatopsis acidicola]